MIVLVILSVLGAIVLTVAVIFGNMMNPTADSFRYGWLIWAGWLGSALLWLAWAVDRWA